MACVVATTATFAACGGQPTGSPATATGNVSTPIPASTAPSASVSATPAASVSPSPAVAATQNPAELVKGTAYHPSIDPAAFSADISNPYFPLTPGRVFTYEGGGEHSEMTVTDATRTIMGVPSVVVRDRVFEHGALTEDTFDWYAQDRAGHVWYFGEATAECDGTKITSRAGSWEAGVDGALPGVVMLARPALGEAYRQEYLRGEAEDVAKVLKLGATLTSGPTTYRGVLVTEERTALEPTIIEHKLYAPSVGLVEERLVRGGTGTVRLTDVSTTSDPGRLATGRLCRR
jgi:hypothetical protein